MTKIQTGEFPAITGIGSYLPPDAVSNDALIARTGMNSSHDAIVQLTKIRQRHFAHDELPSSMGVAAVRCSLASSRVGADEIGGIYVSTITKDMVTPDTAVVMHGQLGLPENATALDIGSACAGSVYTLHAAVGRVETDGRPALAVGLGKMTPITNFDDRRSGILFGDGAGAFVIDTRPDTLRPAFEFLTVPHTEAICVPGGGEARPLESPEDVAGRIAMQGKLVADYAKDLMPRAAVAAARRAGVYDEQNDRIDWDQITAIIPHQANGNLIDEVGRRLKVPQEKVVVTVDRHANTSAASVPLALDHAHKEGRFDPSRRNIVLITAIGAGMAAGAGVMEVNIPQP